MHATLNPYLSFGGRAREAMEFYKSVFGGELTISTFADQHVPNAPADGVMHAQLAVDGVPIIMGSDGMDKEEFNGFSLSLSGNNADELRDYFRSCQTGARS